MCILGEDTKGWTTDRGTYEEAFARAFWLILEDELFCYAARIVHRMLSG